MNLVVVGGHSRNIGKTSVMAELIRALTPPRWVAVKITQYGHGICSLDGKTCECEPEHHGFVLNEEHCRDGRGDTCRFLQAGAQRSLWLRVRQGQIQSALPALERALRGEHWVMIESNSIVGFFDPALYLFVLDPARADFKISARNYVERAHALVAVDSPANLSWPGIVPDLLRTKRRFAVSRADYRSRELNDFVRQKLSLEQNAVASAQ